MGISVYAKKDFSLSPSDLVVDETVFHNANGYLGVRSNFEEGYPDGYNSIRGTYVNGFYDFSYMGQAEKLYGLTEAKQIMLNICDTQSIKISFEGEKFSMFSGEIISRERLLRMKDGVTERNVVWRSPKGREVSIQFVRMASFEILPLFLIQVRIRPLNFSGRIRIESGHRGDVRNFFDPSDPRVAAENIQYLTVTEAEYRDGASSILAKTSKSGLTICSHVKNAISVQAERSTVQEEGEITEMITMDVKQGETITLDKFTVICDSIRYADPKIAARDALQRALNLGIEALFEKQRDYLESLGVYDAVEINGDDELDLSVHYNLYQLIQSVSKDLHGNIAAKGLSGEGYEGHYFWDTEMYLQPFFTLTIPALSKNLIRYRYSILDHARENARILGHKKGAAYPWRTIMGQECSGHYPSGSAQYHISGDVAYAVTAYYLATGDLDLIEECGAEIVFETARLWLDVGNYYKGKFHINEVTGPDEYTCLVNNNYYTNLIARHNLRWAVKFHELLQAAGCGQAVLQKIGLRPSELVEFARASDNMYLPYDEELGINPQDDSFLQKKPWDLSTITEAEKPLLMHYHPMYLYRHMICKQADTVLAHFILEDEQDEPTIRKSFEFYETVTTHDSSLSTCIFSVVASKLGFSEKAYRYFGDSAKLDLFNTHKNTKDGIHTANMGGTYMAIVYGFGGLRIKETGLSLQPSLPSAWTSYRFRFSYRGSLLEVSVDRSMVMAKLLAGPAQRVTIFKMVYELSDHLTISI
ncbi:MAG: glycoside hydrolase family 65 protein [Chloroflexi bacterium]|nr:glycoside hydrolase family 65 protein [Chloroflexota bacterium]